MSISIYYGSSPSIVQACTETRGSLCADTLISKLNGTNENEKKNALDYIASHKIYDRRFLPSLLNSCRSGSFLLFEKATTLLLLYKQNNVSFSLDQETTFLARLNGAKVSLENGGLRVEGENFILPNSNILQSGALYFKEGKIFVPAGGKAVVENIEIDAKPISSRYSRNVEIFFDDKEHGINHPYVALNSTTGQMTAGSGGIPLNLSFLPGNRFIEVPKNAWLETSLDLLSTILRIQNTNSFPQVTVKYNPAFSKSFCYDIPDPKPFLLRNGGSGFEADASLGIRKIESGLARRDNKSGSNVMKSSVPLMLVLRDNAGGFYGTASSNEIILIDEAGNYVYMSDDAPPEVFDAAFACKDNFTRSLRLLDQVETQISKEAKNVLNLRSDWRLSQIYHLLNDYPSEMRNSLKGLEIVKYDQIEEKCGKGTSGCATEEKITIPADFMRGISADVLSHETAHALIYAIETEGQPAVEDFETALKNKYSLYSLVLYYTSGSAMNQCQEGQPCLVAGYASRTEAGKFVPLKASSCLSEEDKAKWLQLKLSADHNPFTEGWNKIAGDVYGRDLGEKDVASGKSSGKWADGTSDPRHGCVRAYGANNYHEDIATFVEMGYSDPDFFQREGLLDPGSPAYDPRYMQKLQLLKEYGFIDEARFSLISEDSE